jgi:hypothetical protein
VSETFLLGTDGEKHDADDDVVGRLQLESVLEQEQEQELENLTYQVH